MKQLTRATMGSDVQTISFDQLLIVGMAGAVYALNKNTGERIWTRTLRGSGLVLITLEKECIFASTGGHVYGIDAATGGLLWDNDMPGAGWGLATLATSNGANFGIDALLAQADSDRRSQSQTG